ncbi:MAG: DUF2723 domain-containing protein [Chloroflexi bacterium]|nr:DUF2723 domain-containing protein [Chloroflexota bacterium]
MKADTSIGTVVRSTTPRLLAVPLFIITFAAYWATAAPGTLFGDPSEYQFIPAIMGIAHPPGYAFYTLLAKVWQLLVPAGTIAYRTNRLASAVAALAVTLVYQTVLDLQRAILRQKPDTPGSPLIPLVAALALGVTPDFWQHAIHANAHIVSVTFAIAHIWLLVHWWYTKQDRWLFVFCILLGAAASHHPITMMGVPAYAVFILCVAPDIARDWRRVLAMAVCALLGLMPLLYYPIRSPSTPFGPTDMRTWQGFLNHATAQGLRVNLFHFGLRDQPNRALIFWSLLKLQYPVSIILLIPVGLLFIGRRMSKVGLLIALFLLGHLLFTLNTVQDVMAYLLAPFAAIAIAAGVGLLALSETLQRLSVVHFKRGAARLCSTGLPLVLIVPLALRAVGNLQSGISLHNFTAADDWVRIVHERFHGQGEGALLLSDWEHLTPIWVYAYTQNAALRDEDLRLIYVSTSNPWVESVWAHIEDGPLYLPDYRPAVRDAGFRIVPEGTLYRVEAPPVSNTAPTHELDVWVDERIHLVGFDLPNDSVRPGDPLTLVLYQHVEAPLTEIWMPYTRLGSVEARWTTDSRLLTPYWQPGEVVVERYEIPIPLDFEPGQYPLQLGYGDLSNGRDALPFSTGDTSVNLATINVLPALTAALDTRSGDDLANLDNQVALESASARVGRQFRKAGWQEPLRIGAGRDMHLVLHWRALATPRDSFTVFVHLIDADGRYISGHDYTPLGGAYPSYLWFPKWLRGQQVADPYRITIPHSLAPGQYWIEVGIYGMTSLQRLPVVDSTGSLAGDRVILGPVEVVQPET